MNWLRKNSWRNGVRLVMAAIIFFFLVLPDFYTYLNKIPPESEWKRTVGVVDFKYKKGRGNLMAVGGVPVSCAGNVHLSQDCIYGEQARESLRGSEVEAVWFRWSIYPMVYENRLLSLRRGAAVIVSIEETRSEIDKGFDRLMRSTIIQLIFMSLAWIAAEWLMRKNERGSDLA